MGLVDHADCVLIVIDAHTLECSRAVLGDVGEAPFRL